MTFFAYTIPGVFYLAILVYTLALFGFIAFDISKWTDMSLVVAGFVVGAGYVTGMVTDYLAELWHRLFNPKGRANPAFESLGTRHPDFKPTFRPSDWYIVLSYLRKEDADQAAEIDRFNAYGIMLRNISFGLIVLAIVHAVYFAMVDAAIGWLILAGALALLSVMAGLKGAEFRLWYYLAIFQFVVANGLQASDFFVRVPAGSQTAIQTDHPAAVADSRSRDNDVLPTRDV